MKHHSRSQPSRRDLAMRVLTLVLSDKTALDDAIEEVLRDSDREARAWLLDICSNALRWKGRIDFIIDSLALKKRPTGWLRKALLMACTQILVQDRVAPPVVVSETVDWIKFREGLAPAQFANALLRKVCEMAEEWKSLPFPKSSNEKDQASWASLPLWMWSRIVKSWGTEWAQAYALASLERPEIWLRAREGAELGEKVIAGPIPGSWKAVEGGLITTHPGFSEGAFIVQDISSQRLIYEVTEYLKSKSVQPGTVLDLCASPGGKSVGLAWSGYQVTATDKPGHRSALLQETVSRISSEGSSAFGKSLKTEFPIKIEALSSVLRQTEPYDLIWVDAPCTGTGIMRRHPEIRWSKIEKDLESLSKIQSELVMQGWSRVKSGGYLMVSVCSVLKEEGHSLVRSALPDQILEKEWLLAPQESDGGDGFWGGLIRKP